MREPPPRTTTITSTGRRDSVRTAPATAAAASWPCTRTSTWAMPEADAAALQLVQDVVPGGAAPAGDQPDPQRHEGQRPGRRCARPGPASVSRASRASRSAASLPSVKRTSMPSITSDSRPVGAYRLGAAWMRTARPLASRSRWRASTGRSRYQVLANRATAMLARPSSVWSVRLK